MDKNMYDVVIVGSGPAGMSAAIYSGRAGYKTLMVEEMASGGQMMLTDIIDNYPGFPDGISGFELQERMFKQAQKFNAEFKNGSVKSISKNDKIFSIILDNNEEIKSYAVIIATGAKHRHLNVKGEKEYASRGVSYCGTCDGPFYRNRDVVVIGGGDSALTEALFIAKFAKKITIIHRKDRFRAVNSLVEQAKKDPKIEYRFNSVVTEIGGSNFVEWVKINNLLNNSEEKISTDGVFIFIGLDPNSSFLDKAILDENGYVIVDNKMQTKITGLFAAGDIVSGTFRQVICAASDGAKASYYAGEYIDDLKGHKYK